MLETGLARDRFPLLARRIGDRPLHYLDTAATSQKPTAVLDALDRYYRFHNANVHRGLNTLAAEATEAYETCRSRVATWVNAPTREGVVITRGATTSLNLIARGLEHRLEAGDEILLTEMEHHANLVPWQMLARRRGLQLRFLPVRDDGRRTVGRLLPNMGRGAIGVFNRDNLGPLVAGTMATALASFYDDDVDYPHASYRDNVDPSYEYYDSGFRVSEVP